jgi:hypothetical protein
MKGDKLHCIVVREADGDEGSYSLFIRTAPTDYFDTAMLDLVREEIYEQLDNCAKDGATEVLLVEDGEMENMHWNAYYKTESIKPVEPDVEEEPDHPRERVTRDMALDAGDPSLEGQPI